ncbi:MAG: hypothetical protein K9J13_00565 [Saprospiraceae bacterium]|nr:hypothetical protein [Saprospiraceae bacterium]
MKKVLNHKLFRLSILLVMFLWFFSGVFPITRFESDSMGICNGCYEIINSGDWGANFFSYSYDMQAGTYWFIIIFMKLLALPASVVYSILSAIFGILCLILISNLISKILNKDFILILLVLFLFQEVYSISFYANSTVFAAFFWLLTFNIVYSGKGKWVYPIAVILLAVAFWCRVDVAFAMTGILPLLWLKIDLKRAIIISLIIGICTVCLGLLLMYLSNVNIQGFLQYSNLGGITYRSSSDIGFLNIISLKSHFAFFSALVILLVIIGLFILLREKQFKLVLLILIPTTIYYMFNLNFTWAAKHLYYYSIFWAIPVVYAVHYSLKNKIMRLIIVVVFVLQYLVGWQVNFKSLPWQFKDYAVLYPEPEYTKLVNFPISLSKISEINLVLGSGTKIPTADEMMMSSGLVFSPLMWKNLKTKYKNSFNYLEEQLDMQLPVFYISTSQSSNQHILNVLLENGWSYLPDETAKYGFDKWHDFQKENRIAKVYISNFDRDTDNFMTNFAKLGQSEFHHIAIWDWENYLLRENMAEIAEPVSDFVYEICLEDTTSGKLENPTTRLLDDNTM